MYRPYYRLQKNVNHKDIAVEELFNSTGYKEARARLDYMKDKRGLVLVSGLSGVGKTTLLRSFAESLDPKSFKIHYVPLSTVSVNDFYRQLAYLLSGQTLYKKDILFHCFTHCGGGSIFDFVMKMERMEFYAAARKIWETFYPSSSSAPTATPAPASRRFNFNSNFTHGADTPFLLQHLYLTHNDNLFRRPGVPILKLQITHPYLEKRNISPSLAMSFHMGYCKHVITHHERQDCHPHYRC